jgi:hypothetical protein
MRDLAITRDYLPAAKPQHHVDPSSVGLSPDTFSRKGRRERLIEEENPLSAYIGSG